MPRLWPPVHSPLLLQSCRLNPLLLLVQEPFRQHRSPLANFRTFNSKAISRLLPATVTTLPPPSLIQSLTTDTPQLVAPRMELPESLWVIGCESFLLSSFLN